MRFLHRPLRKQTSKRPDSYDQSSGTIDGVQGDRQVHPGTRSGGSFRRIPVSLFLRWRPVIEDR